MTPREFAQQLEGYRWRDEREWQRLATQTAYTIAPWGSKLTPKDLFDLMTGKPVTDEAAFERLAGLDDPGAALDAMYAKQAARKS